MRNPPGGRIMTTQGSKLGAEQRIPRTTLPLPEDLAHAPQRRSGRTANPTPMPSGVGQREPDRVRLEANASCRPRIRQLTTISEMKAPSSLCTVGHESLED